MEEISRSNAIKVMNTWKFICSLCDNVEPRAIGVTRFEMIDTCTKAISDMQKLEKIEKTIKCYHSTSCDMCALDKCGEKTECSEGYLIKIKQILRG